MAKKVIDKEKIVEAATRLVSEKGMEALNARDVAKLCGCSTQPIYLCFDGLAQLKIAVVKKMEECYDKYIGTEIASGKYPQYKASGMGYIRFAKEQPYFFKYMFMRQRQGDSESEAYRFHREALLATQYGFDVSEAERMHTHMWIYVHGIATMYATGFLNWDWETVSNLLTEEFFAVKNKLFGENHGN